MRHPLEAHLIPTPGRPAGLAARESEQEHRRVSHLRSGCTKPGQTHRMSTQCPPFHGLPSHRSDPRDVDDVSMGRADPGSPIAPTGLWCPRGSHSTARAPPPPLPSRSHHDSSPIACIHRGPTPPCDRIGSREIWILGAKPHARATQSQGSAGSGHVFPPARTGALGDWTWT